MTIENSTIGLAILIILTIIQVMFWRMIAEYIGRKLGVGKFILNLFERKRRKLIKSLEAKIRNSEFDLIKLKKVTKGNIENLMSIELYENQQKYVPSIEKSLAIAYVEGNNVHPFVIYKENCLIGFIMTRYNSKDNNHCIYQLMIDMKYQNQGYGKKSIIKTIHWILKHNNCSEFVTTVIKGNNYAENMYNSLGFKQISETIDGACNFKLNIDELKIEL